MDPIKNKKVSRHSYAVTGKSLKFVDFQIVVQLILVLVRLRISCTTTKNSTDLRLLPVTVHMKHVVKSPNISGALPASEAVSMELVLADEAGHARGVPPERPRHDELPPVQPPRDQMLQRRLLPLRLGRRHCAPRNGVGLQCRRSETKI